MRAIPVFEQEVIRKVIDVSVSEPEVEDLRGITEVNSFWVCLAPSDDWTALVVLDDKWYYVTTDNRTGTNHVWRLEHGG